MRSTTLGGALLALALLCQPLSAADTSESEPPARLSESIRPLGYDLALEIDTAGERFGGVARIAVALSEPITAFWLHAEDLEILEAFALDAAGERIPADFSEAGDSGFALFRPARPLGPGAATLVVRYAADYSDDLAGLYRVEGPGEAYVYSDFQPLDARRAFPSFDEPRFKAPFDIALTIGGKDLAVSNAPERSVTLLPDGRRRIVFDTTEPIPTYLVAIAVGPFDLVEAPPIPPNAVRSWPVPLRGVAPKGEGAQLAYALEITAPLLAILEDYFASPYPYAKLDLVAPLAFSASGMENVGAIFYRRDRILLGDAPSLGQQRSFAGLHAHELAHSWFGNLVTPAWWDDLWLNEAFATWLAERTIHAWRPQDFDARGPLRSARWAMWSDRLAGARQIRQPIESEHDIVAAFDDITYSKGAGVLAMIERYMGAEAFRDGVRLYMAANAHGVATAEDFHAALAAAGADPLLSQALRDFLERPAASLAAPTLEDFRAALAAAGAGDPAISRAFRSFLEQPGTPLVALEWTCGTDGSTELTLRQSRGLPLGSRGERAQVWTIPLCLLWPEPDGLAEHCLMLEAAEVTVALPTGSCPAWIHANGDGAAYLDFALPAEAWTALIADLHRLPPAEAIAAVGSIGAAFDAGLASSEHLLQAAAVAARSPDWDVVRAPMQDLRDWKNFVVPAEREAEAMAVLRALYRPALDEVALDEAALAIAAAESGVGQLRDEILWFLALDADDPELHALLAGRGRAYLGMAGPDGGDGRLHPEVLHPDLVQLALVAAAEAGGAPFATRLIERLDATEDAVLRAQLIYALGFQIEPATRELVWALILDPALPLRDAGQLLRNLGRRVPNAEAHFAWIVANYEALKERMTASYMGWLPWRASALCTEAGRDRVREFFTGRVEAYRGGPKALADVLEAIELCAAIAAVQGPDAAAALERWR